MYKAVEDAIVGRLAPLQSANLFHLFNAPDTRNVLNPQAKAMVFFAGESFSPPSPLVGNPFGNPVTLSQDSTLQWAIVLDLVNLQTHAKIYPLIEAVKLALSGFTPEVEELSLGHLIPDSINFISLHDGAAWKYRIMFSLKKYGGN
jgi:hypothetical protein